MVSTNSLLHLRQREFNSSALFCSQSSTDWSQFPSNVSSYSHTIPIPQHNYKQLFCTIFKQNCILGYIQMQSLIILAKIKKGHEKRTPKSPKADPQTPQILKYFNKFRRKYDSINKNKRDPDQEAASKIQRNPTQRIL